MIVIELENHFIRTISRKGPTKPNRECDEIVYKILTFHARCTVRVKKNSRGFCCVSVLYAQENILQKEAEATPS